MATELVYTSLDEINAIHSELRTSFNGGKAKSIQFRKEQLLQLAYMLQDNGDRLSEALYKDLKRSAVEAYTNDIGPVIKEALLAHDKIESWVKPERGPFDPNFFIFSPQFHKQPKGVVLVISPFNYPLYCSGAIVGAIAAGCPFVLKLSENTPSVAQLLAELFPKYLDQVCEDDHKFSYILTFTRVGRIVASAAAKHLTPVTLELGGKSPVLVDSNADFEVVARRVLWGRMCNSGQTCLAPEYILVHESQQERLVKAFQKTCKDFYGEDPRKSESYCRICTLPAWERLTTLLTQTKGRIVLGGDADREERYIAPTIVQDVSFDDILMEEELFGPILSIVPIRSFEIGVQYINAHGAPLALYVFSEDSKFCAYVRDNTISGSFLVNDTVIHGASMTMPFGGVGASGYGAQKGIHSFNTFTHRKPCFKSPKWFDRILNVRFPPYTVRLIFHS
ncbi:hypothetical protein M422DRAFT_190818 [Sphaerobolus stellatus SS14]|uniref:Aldehyde dehydrogenase n=1 Tax=Sphaerobolus stellatus (strain SS14) TaxID=990650 RepID=A0A0C9U0U5_SPHS4|nr:hypothetical protein M422DRAFT_190818 [Sphaerobolus stellatus SS14]